jgi:localization factor PodJL
MRSVPWHVKGVAPAARETAQEAARRSGLSVGEWLNSVIFGSADKRQPSPRPPRQYPPRPRPLDPSGCNLGIIDDRLDHLTRQIDRLAHASPTAGRDADDDAMPRRLADAIASVDQRLDQLIREGRHATNELERRVTSVDRALANLGQERLRTAFVTAPDNVDQAVAEVAARQRVLDSDLSGPAAYAPPPRPSSASRGSIPASSPAPAGSQFGPDLSGLEQQLKQITTQIESLHRPCRVDEAVAALHQELAEVSRTLSEAMPRRAIEALEAQLSNIARDIGAQGGAGRGPGPEGPALAGLERGLAEVRDVLRGLTPAENLVGFDEAVKTLSRKVDMLATSGQDPAALQQVESSIVGLRGIVSHVASAEALAALAADVRTLADRVERSTQAPSNDFLINLERRIGAIAEAIETVRLEGSRQVPPGLDILMQALSDKLERIQLTRTDQLALGNLEERITRLVEKLDASEAKLGHLGAIERGMAELLVHLEEMRSGQAAAGSRAAAAEPPPAAPVLPDALTHDLAQIKQSQSTVGRQTEDSLEAVQGTIGDVVSRLAMIESDLRTEPKVPTRPSGGPAPEGGPDRAGSSDPARPPEPPAPPRLGSPTDLSEPATDLSEPASAPAAPARLRPAAPPRQPIDSSLPPDYPLEPGSGAPRSMLASPADRIAASEAPLRAAKAAPAEAQDQSSFLQAARRAAKAAAAQQAAPRSATMPADPGDPDAATKTLSERMKQLLVGVGIVVAVAGSFRFAGIYLDPDRVILSDAPVQRSEVAQLPAQLPADLPSTARAIAVPDQMLPDAPPARLPRTPAITPAFAGGAAAISSVPASGTIVAQPATPAATVANAAVRSDITGSVPTRDKPAIASAALTESAAPAPPPGQEPSAPVISKGLIAAALVGDAAAAHEIATRYAEGRGVAQSYKEAASWYERAAKRGLVPAQFRLGTLYEKGLGVAKDLQEARRLYLTAADKGNAKAMHNLAVLYAEGIDGKPDYKSAIQWFRKAANYGIADSQYNLAVLYARGIGVEQNLTESFKWFALAANSGDQEAIKKRDDVAARLDPQTLVAARLAAQSWTAQAQPEEATTVNPPPGGWDQVAAPAISAAKAKVRLHPPGAAAR